jgi:hypothetical protein
MAGPVFYIKTVCRLQRSFLKGFICLPHPAFEDPFTKLENLPTTVYLASPSTNTKITDHFWE